MNTQDNCPKVVKEHEKGTSMTSLILRRSRSLAVAHSLPSPSDGLHSRSCSWRHDALVLSAPIATLLRNGQKWYLRARYSKLYSLKFLISENMLHSIWLAERTRASWRHEHDLEWSPSDGDGKGESAWPRATWTVWASGYSMTILIASFSNSLIIHALMTQSDCFNSVRCMDLDTQWTYR